MLDAFIIEELRRKEREANRRADDNRLRLPVPGREDEGRKRHPEAHREQSEAPRVEFPVDDARDANLVDFSL